MKDKTISPAMDAAYERFLIAIRENAMEQKIKEGVLLGFSGGPDSMMLLHCLLRYKKTENFPLVAVHVHHGIRGESADRDAAFAEQVCKEKNVDFICKMVNVPAFAKEKRIGIEEAARILRYSCFDDIIQGRNDISTIAVAHNSTDNLETVLFNLMRGSGSCGASGIAPVRDNVIRPLLLLSKEEILDALSEAGIAYAIDETNQDTTYTRNYIRKEILPRLYRLSAEPEVSVCRFCRNIRSDNDYLDGEAERAFSSIENDVAKSEFLSALHPAIFPRVMMRWGRKHGLSFTQRQLEILRARLLKSGHFSLDLGGGFAFCRDCDSCFFENNNEFDGSFKCFEARVFPNSPVMLKNGAFILTNGDCLDFLPNIYNFSIKQNLGSVIIEGELFLRYREDGDSYFYGGMTHKLKKLFNDKKIPIRERALIPILCDSKGIVWVPGFGVRDDGGSDNNTLIATYFY